MYGDSVFVGINNWLSKLWHVLAKCGWCGHRLVLPASYPFVHHRLLRLLLFLSCYCTSFVCWRICSTGHFSSAFCLHFHCFLPFVTFPLIHSPSTFPTPHLSVGGAKMKLTFKVRPSSLIFAQRRITNGEFFVSTGFETTKVHHRCWAIGDGKFWCVLAAQPTSSQCGAK